MSNLHGLLYGSLEETRDALQETLTLEETQCALINAIRHISVLEARIEKLVTIFHSAAKL